MGRGKHEHCWKHVTRVENENKWICKYCNDKFSGGASRIEAHLGLNGKGGGIRRCSNYPPVAGNEGVQNNNNMASTSSNPPPEVAINRVYSTQDKVAEGIPEMICTPTSSSVNHQNNAEIMNLSEGVNGSDGNRCVSISEIDQIKQMVLDLECEENVIAKQQQSLESRGKKRKREVDVWLRKLQDMKGNLSNDTSDVSKLIENLKKLKEEKPLTLSTEFVGEELDLNIKRVFKLLEDDKVFVIGICGMGGVGKTLLATLVEDEVKRKATFKDVFWVTVSHNYNISKLQHDIAQRIDVKLDEDDERIRAKILSLAFEKKGKSILILDDVWKYIDLQKVGIHPKVNGIKVILTTRLKHVCHQMDCQTNDIIQMFPLCCLKESEDEVDEDKVDEGWELFMLKLGHDETPRTLPHEIEEIVRCIVERFKGLPLGINLMARTMDGNDDIHQWKHALSRLQKLEMRQVMEEVFKVLKCSYDNLMEKDLQNCFLYCALFSIDDEGWKINKDELIMKLVDNGQINENMSLEEIFDEGNTILSKLESHSLISSTNNSSVYTHPLVRNMACYILKECQRNVIVKLNKRLTEIPLSHRWATDLELVHMRDYDIEEIPEGMSPNCPKLFALILNELSISRVPESFFMYMNNLSILDLSYNEDLESLPDSITKLRSLVSLILKGCDSLKHVPPLGELQRLSRLVISNTSIGEVKGLEKLIKLKWLDLSCNKSLNLELGSLSNLTKMQYLDLRNTCAMMAVKDVQGMNMLECFGGTFDCKDYDCYRKTKLELKAYHLTFANKRERKLNSVLVSWRLIIASDSDSMLL
ncbi:probable disease resistance protein At1g61300 [Medicago truncatula]|uniref:probable disease resistance protein At1g61300 n=1 Tax=Medicago truncatula TaxID=3880 RepID=UPI0019689659|nr:probable disease resistance protein At1g61300 [Medicago truncatula]